MLKLQENPNPWGLKWERKKKRENEREKEQA